MNDATVTDWDVLNAAHGALRAAVMGVGEEGWALPTPCDQWNVTQVLQHAAGDQLAYVAAITGQGGPAEDPFAPSGQLDEAALAMTQNALGASARAWGTVARDAAAVPSPLPQGALPAEIAVGACALDAAVHAWDIARATGQRSPLTAELARSLYLVAVQIVEPLRAYGAYAPAIDGDGAGREDGALGDDGAGGEDGAGRDDGAGGEDAAGLLRYLGRRPDWTAP
jgi:uncharacterized protein (TIGR03086 family)